MTHPLTPREKVAEIVREGMKRLAASQAGARPVVSASKEADRVTDAILTALASGSGDHAELARLADMSASIIALHGPAPSLDNLPVDPQNWSGIAHAKILAEHRLALLAENAALRSANAEAERKLAEAVEVGLSIYIYANDTLSGRIDGPDDRAWQRAAVVEIRNRARVFRSKEAERG